MSGVERIATCRGRRPVRRIEPSLCGQALLEVAALHVAHRDVEQVVDLAGLVDRDDVRVVDRGGQLRLAQEALAERSSSASSGASSLSATLRSSRRSSAR